MSDSGYRKAVKVENDNKDGRGTKVRPHSRQDSGWIRRKNRRKSPQRFWINRKRNRSLRFPRQTRSPQKQRSRQTNQEGQGSGLAHSEESSEQRLSGIDS